MSAPNTPRTPHNPSRPPVHRPHPGTVEDARSLQERLRLFLIVLLGLVIVTQLELPFRLAGILLALFGGWLGIRLLIRMGRTRPNGLGAGGWVIAFGGLGLAGVLLLTLLTQVVYYPVISDQEKCLGEANTRTAQQICNATANRRLDEVMHRFSPGAK